MLSVTLSTRAENLASARVPSTWSSSVPRDAETLAGQAQLALRTPAMVRWFRPQRPGPGPPGQRVADTIIISAPCPA